MNSSSGDDLPRFALAVYRSEGVPEACLLLQNRLDLDVNLVLFGAYVGVARGLSLSEADLATTQRRVQDWHSEVVRPLRAIRRRLKTGPSPAPTPATIELRNKLQELEIESELIELGRLGEAAAGLRGPATPGSAADRAVAGITTVVRAAAGRDLDDVEMSAVAVIAAAAALVGITEDG